MHNARLAERAPFGGQVDIVPVSGDRALREWAEDVSETGMFVHTKQPFRVGDNISLRFDHAQDEVHIRAAEVVWVRRPESVVPGQPAGIGVRFVSVDPTMRSALRRMASTTRSQPPSTSPTTAPSAALARRAAEDTDDRLHAAPGGPPLRHAFATSGVPGPLSISLPPEDPSLSSEARVFAGVPAAPRAVTIGPRPRSTPPAAATTTAPVAAMTTPPADPFAGWTFRRAEPPAPSAGHTAGSMANDANTPATLRLRFDDDAPRALSTTPRRNDSVIDNPSVLQSTTIPPIPSDDGFALGALPAPTERAFVDGTLSVRHLPLSTERRPAPGAAPVRVSLRAAAAFLVAGCCGGVAVGLLQRDASPDVTPTSVAAALNADGPAADARTADTPADNALNADAPADDALNADALPGALPGALADAAAAAAAATLAPGEVVTRAAVDVVAGLPPPAKAPPVVVDVATAEQALPPAAVADAAVDADDATSPAPPAATTMSAATSATASATTKTASATTKTAASATTKTTATKTPPPGGRGGGAGRLEFALARGGRVQKAFALASPARVVVDVKGAALPARLPDVAGAREVRVGRPEKGVERVVIVLDGNDKPEEAKAKIAGGRLVVRWRR
jgi:uncharacterized protein (TIGR02266 family)